jgi:excisionase family DNA binding protein
VEDDVLTIDEAAVLMQNDADTVRAWIERGLPTVQRADGTVGIRRADLDAFLLKEGQGLARDASEA